MAIATVLAEFKAKDNATGTLKKIDSELKKAKKSTAESEKSLKQLETQAKKTASTWEKFKGTIAKTKEKISKTDKFSAGVVTGGAGGFLTGIAGVFGVGGLASAMIGAMQEMSAEFVSGAQILKEQKLSLANYNLALKNNAEALKNAFTKNRFIRRDLEVGLTALSDLGITSQTLKEYAKEIELFADAQGYESITEALQALTAGTIKAGRGIDAVQTELLKSYATLLQNQFTADQGMKLIGDLLRKNAINMKTTGNQFKSVAQNIVQLSNTIEQQEEDFAARAVTKETMQAYMSSFAAREQVRALKQVAGQGATYAISKIQKVLPKRAQGGTVEKNKAYVVGEHGTEIFIPKTSGEILPTKKTYATKLNDNRENIVINMTNNIRITTSQPTTETAIANAIEDVVRKLYRPLTQIIRSR